MAMFLQDQHCIAVAEETITAADRLAISLSDELDSRQSAHENQQAASREVKIGDERIQSQELVAWLDEHAGVSSERAEHAPAVCRSGFESACRGSTDSHDSTAEGTASPERLGRLSGELSPLRMHCVIADLYSLDRPECVDANVQDQVDPADSPRGELMEDRLAKMET